MHYVFVEYDGGLSQATDEKIFAAADYDFDKGRCDSGCDIGGSQTRDLAFYYESSAKAMAAEVELKKIPDIRVKIEMAC